MCHFHDCVKPIFPLPSAVLQPVTVSTPVLHTTTYLNPLQQQLSTFTTLGIIIFADSQKRANSIMFITEVTVTGGVLDIMYIILRAVYCVGRTTRNTYDYNAVQTSLN